MFHVKHLAFLVLILPVVVLAAPCVTPYTVHHALPLAYNQQDTIRVVIEEPFTYCVHWHDSSGGACDAQDVIVEEGVPGGTGWATVSSSTPYFHSNLLGQQACSPKATLKHSCTVPVAGTDLSLILTPQVVGVFVLRTRVGSYTHLDTVAVTEPPPPTPESRVWRGRRVRRDRP